MKNKQIEPKHPPGNGHQESADKALKGSLQPTPEKRWHLWATLVAALVLSFTVWIEIEWFKRPILSAPPASPVLPSFLVALENLKLTFQGLATGYRETFQGYMVFIMMCGLFHYLGKTILDLILMTRTIIQNGLQLTFIERTSLSFILGSTATAIIILGFGTVGAFNSITAWGMAIIGVVLLIAYLSKEAKQLINFAANNFKTKIISTEGITLGVLLILLVIWSTVSTRPQTYSDPYQIHLPLPSAYIHQGKIATNPYSIYSYFPQNLEMLVMWGLALKSEVASGLVMWAYFASLLALIGGFFMRHYGKLSAYAAVFIAISAPVVAWFSTAIKNDLPAGILIVAHYLCIYEGLDHKENENQSRRWMFLSGLLCGGAIGFKFTSIIPAAVSTLMLCILDMRSVLRKTKGFNLLFWFLGLVIFSSPWLIRSYIETGNPIYPYLNNFLGNDLIKPWHVPAQISSSVTGQGFAGLKDYFFEGIGIKRLDGIISQPNWGTSLFLSILALPILASRRSPALSITLSAVALTLLIHLSYSLEIRYHIPYVLLIVAFPLAFLLNLMSPWNGTKKWAKIATLSILGMSLVQSFNHANMVPLLRTSFSQMLSGFTPGNFALADWDQQAEDLRWMTHLINTRTDPKDGVLFAGLTYGFGVKRKFYFGVDPDKQILHDLADNSKNAVELRRTLESMGIQHILFDPMLFRTYKNHFRKELALSDESEQKINALLSNEMDLRFKSPSGTIYWFSMKGVNALKPITLTPEDARLYSISYERQAEAFLNSGALEVSEELLNKLPSLSIPTLNKVYGLALLANVLRLKGEISKAEDTLNLAIQFAPRRPEPYLYCALFYNQIGKRDRIYPLIRKAVDFGGTKMIMSISDLSPYLRD